MNAFIHHGSRMYASMYDIMLFRKETNLNILSMPVMPKPVGVHNQTDSDRIIIEWLYEVMTYLAKDF